MKSLFILCVFILSFFCVTTSPVFASTTHDISTLTNYNIRVDGASAGDVLSLDYNATADLDNDGKRDLIINALYHNTQTGSVYIIFNSLFKDISGLGQTIDLNNPDNYSLRYDGASPYILLGYSGEYTGDLDNDGKTDLIINSPGGAVYVIYNALINSQASSGKNYSFSSSSNYSIRFYTTSASSLGFARQKIIDVNGDGKDDLIIPAPKADYNLKTDSGSTFVIYNDLISRYTGPGQNIDLDTNTNYSLRFDGATAGNKLSWDYVYACDVDNNSHLDLFVPERYTDYNGRADSGSLYIIYDSVFHNFSGPGKTFNLGDSTNYSLRFDGSGINSQLGHTSSIDCTDLDNDGKADIIAGEILADNNSRPNSGSVYVINNSLISTFSTKTHELADSNNYSFRFDGASAGEMLGDYGISSADFNSDNKQDLILGDFRGSNGTDTSTGGVYIIYSDLFSNYSSKNIDLANPSNFNIKYYGSADSVINHESYIPNDINGDGSPDLLLSSWQADFNSRSDSGSFYIIYNFPHTISVTAVATPTTNNTPTITGLISAPNSVTNISGVQYQADSNTISGTWTACSASDGAFDSTSENYSCSISSLADGAHTLYFRAYDANTSYTPQSNYASVSVTVDATDPEGFSWQTLSRRLKASGGDMIHTVADGGFTSDHKVALSWEKEGDATSGIESYKVYYREKGDKKWILIDEVSADTDFVWVDEDPGEYEWYVKAIDYAGNETDSKIFTFTIVATPEGAPIVNLVNGVAPVSGNVYLGRSDTLTVEGSADSESGVVVAIYDPVGQTRYQEILCNSDSAGFFTCTDAALMNSSYLLKIFSRNEVGDEGPVTEIMINPSIYSAPTAFAPATSHTLLRSDSESELQKGEARSVMDGQSSETAMSIPGITPGAVDMPQTEATPDPPRQNIFQWIWSAFIH